MSDIFEQAKGTEPEAQQTTSPQVEATPQQPQAAVEYNGKVWKQEDIINKFENADSYINQLKAENEELRLKANRGATLDDVLSRMDNTQNTTTPVEPTKPPVVEVDVEAVAMNAYQKLKQQEQMEANLQGAISKLSETYGEKTIEVLKEKASEFDLSLDEAKELAMTRPKLFAAQFLAGTQQKVVGNTTGNINTQTLQSQQKAPKLKDIKDKASFQQELNRRFAEKAATMQNY